jgi:putative hydrolase of the HAD superfamily
MNQYMVDRLHIPAEQVPGLRHDYYVTFGTTLNGLRHHYQVDPLDFLNYVHDLPIEKMLKPDPHLRDLLLSLPQQRFIFTNADRPHAQRVLDHLGIADCFVAIIDVWALDFHCKPDILAYQIALDTAHETDPVRCIYLDDSAVNLLPARQMGFYTVLIGEHPTHPAALHVIQSPHALRAVAPEIWENGSHGLW